MMELLIVNRKVNEILGDKRITIYDTLIGSFCTSQEMAGFSITLMKLDDELKKYYDMPASSFALTKA
jgi:dihydroxyacetone kinase-like protein